MGFFQQPKIRKFNYQPVFYDERKEALQNKIDAAEREKNREYVPGASIKGSFRRMEVARKELKYKTKQELKIISKKMIMTHFARQTI